MADDDQTGYDDGTSTQSAQPATRTPFRGMRVRSRSTGQTYYWVGGQYIAENDPRRLAQSDLKIRNDALSAAQNYQRMLPDMNRFQELNRQTGTGSLAANLGTALGDLPELMPSWIDQRGGANVQEMRAITNRWAPQMRPAGSGSSSDTDVRMFRGALPNRTNTGPGNDQIISDIRRNAQNAQDQSDFYEWFWPRHGNLNGAQGVWNQYLQERARQPNLSWRQYFHADSGSAAPTQQTQGPPPPQGVDPATWQYMTPQERALWQTNR